MFEKHKIAGEFHAPEFDMEFFLQLGILLDRRVWFYVFPVLSFVLLYSKLPHKVMPFSIAIWGAFQFMPMSVHLIC